MGLANLQVIARRVLKAFAERVMPDPRDEMSMAEVGIWASLGTQRDGDDIRTTLVPWRRITYAAGLTVGTAFRTARFVPINVPMNVPLLVAQVSGLIGHGAEFKTACWSADKQRWESMGGDAIDGGRITHWAYMPQEPE